MGEYFKGFSLADHTPPTRSEPAWQKMAQFPLNGTTLPVEIQEEGRSPTMNEQTKAEVKKIESNERGGTK